MNNLIGILLYFGAYLIPIVYLCLTRGRGQAKKRIVLGMAIHTFWNCAVWGFVHYSFKAGYSEYYWGWALLIPVNIVSALYYTGTLLYVANSSLKAKEI